MNEVHGLRLLRADLVALEHHLQGVAGVHQASDPLRAAGAGVANGAQLRALAHLLAAESAQALQDKPAREEHLQLALEQSAMREDLGP